VHEAQRSLVNTASSRVTNLAQLGEHDEQSLRLGMLAEWYFPEDPNTGLLKRHNSGNCALTRTGNILHSSAMDSTSRLSLFAAVATFGASASIAQAALYTFDSEAELNGLSPLFLATRSDTGGISGGSLVPINVTRANTIAPDAGFPAEGKVYNVSASFHITGSTPPNQGVGFFDSSGRNLGSFTVPWVTAVPTFTYHTGHFFDGPWVIEGHATMALEGAFSPTTGPTWLKYTLAAEFIGGSAFTSQWQYSARVEDLGADGLSPAVTLFASAPLTLTIDVPVPSTGIHGAFYSYGPVGAPTVGTDHIDNFLVIPEPSAALLGGLGALSLGLTRSRRRSMTWT
jgi:hypothetical protein